MWLKVSEDTVNEILIKHSYIENGVVSEVGVWMILFQQGARYTKKERWLKSLKIDLNKPPLTDKQQLFAKPLCRCFFHHAGLWWSALRLPSEPMFVNANAWILMLHWGKIWGRWNNSLSCVWKLHIFQERNSCLTTEKTRCGIVYKVLKIPKLQNTTDELFTEHFGSHPINFDQLC